MALIKRRPCFCANSATKIFVEMVSMQSSTKSMRPSHSSRHSAYRSSNVSASTNECLVMTRALGLISRHISRITSIFRRPIVLWNAMTWRFTLLGDTTSRSMSTKRPTPPRTSASTQLEPTPPNPSTMTVAFARRSMPSSPMIRRKRESAASSPGAGSGAGPAIPFG